jgi:CheY-like chemotaxis protein
MTEAAILIVDDNPINLKLARVILASEGYMVKTADDAEEALAALEEFEPALILMDLQLPGMDGLTLTRQLRRDPRWSSTWIVALTAYAMKGDEAKALAAGCDGYLTKPIDADGLPQAVAAFVAKKRGER